MKTEVEIKRVEPLWSLLAALNPNAILPFIYYGTTIMES